jgi:DNA repair exonuclease SbcCD ATPase subunit
MSDEIKELKKQVEELKKENTELQRELSVHNFLDTGVPQERLDYQRELKKEIIRLKSLNRRAADEIRDLDNIIIGYVENYEDLLSEMKAIDGE